MYERAYETIKLIPISVEKYELLASCMNNKTKHLQPSHYTINLKKHWKWHQKNHITSTDSIIRKIKRLWPKNQPVLNEPATTIALALKPPHPIGSLKIPFRLKNSQQRQDWSLLIDHKTEKKQTNWVILAKEIHWINRIIKEKIFKLHYLMMNYPPCSNGTLKTHWT